jgi:hypothetical protein
MCLYPTIVSGQIYLCNKYLLPLCVVSYNQGKSLSGKLDQEQKDRC